MRRSSAAWTSSAPRRVRVSSSTRSVSSRSRAGFRRSRKTISAWIASGTLSPSAGQKGQNRPKPDSAQTTIRKPTISASTSACTRTLRPRTAGAWNARRMTTWMPSTAPIASQTHAGQK